MPIFRVAPTGPVPTLNLVGEQSRLRLVSGTPGTIELSSDVNGYLRLTSAGAATFSTVTDNASAVAHSLNTTLALTAVGSKLLSLLNNSVEKAYVDKDGALFITGVGAGANAINLVSGARLNFGQGGDDQLYGDGGAIRTLGGLQAGVLYSDSIVGSTGTITVRPLGVDSASYVGLKVVQNTAQTLAGGKLVSVFSDNGVTERAFIDHLGGYTASGVYASVTVGSGGAFIAATSNTLNLTANAPSTGSATGTILNNTQALTTGDKLLSIRNNNSEKTYVAADGSLVVSGVASGSPALSIPDGSRIVFDGAGGVRHLYASGSNLVYVGGFSVGVQAVSCASVYPGGTAALNLRGRIADGASAIGIKVGAVNTLNTAGAKIIAFYNDDVTTEVASIGRAGNLTILGSDASANSIVVPSGGRINFDGATSLSTYIAWNGALLTTARSFSMPGCLTSLIYPNAASDLQIRGRLAAGAAGAGNIKLGSVNVLTGTDKIISFYSDSFVTERAYITLEGSYVQTTGLWDDVPCRIAQAGGASALTFEAYRDTTFFAYFLRHDQDDTLHLEWQMPHTWDPSTNVKPHVHITPMVNPAADQVVRFTGKYVWSQVGVETPADASWTSFTVDTTITTTDAFKEKVVGLADVAPPSNPKESNILLMWLRRPGNTDAADTYTTSKATGTAAANIKVTSIDAHIRKNKRGTVNEIP